MVYNLPKKQISVDKRFKVDINGNNYLVKVIFDKKLKNIKNKYFFDHILLRVPVDTSKEDIIKYLNTPYRKKWLEAERANGLKSIDLIKRDIKKYDIKLEEKSMDEFKKLVNKYIKKYESRFIHPKQVTYRHLNKAWAQCAKSKDKLIFDYKMRYLPESYIEHIVYHELIHTYCLNHNVVFQRRMEEVYPDFRDWEQGLVLYYYLIYTEEKYI